MQHIHIPNTGILGKLWLVNVILRKQYKCHFSPIKSYVRCFPNSFIYGLLLILLLYLTIFQHNKNNLYITKWNVFIHFFRDKLQWKLKNNWNKRCDLQIWQPIYFVKGVIWFEYSVEIEWLDEKKCVCIKNCLEKSTAETNGSSCNCFIIHS